MKINDIHGNVCQSCGSTKGQIILLTRNCCNEFYVNCYCRNYQCHDFSTAPLLLKDLCVCSCVLHSSLCASVSVRFLMVCLSELLPVHSHKLEACIFSLYMNGD